MIITSADNKTYKLAKSLLQKRGRLKSGLFIAEGERIVEDAVNSAEVKFLIFSEDYSKNTFENCPAERMILKNSLFNEISDTVSSQGVIAICNFLPYIDVLNGNESLIVICDNIQDPGNLGTIFRTAESAGADGIILANACVDALSPKVVRASMGSVFRLPIYIENMIDSLKSNGFSIYAATVDSSEKLYSINFREKTAVILGNEANGVSEELTKRSDKSLYVPMQGRAESLNVATSAAVILFEIMRQKGDF